MNIQAMEKNYKERNGKTRWVSKVLKKKELIDLLNNDDKKVIINGLRLRNIDEIPTIKLIILMLETPRISNRIHKAIDKKQNNELNKRSNMYFNLIGKGYKHNSASMMAYGGII
jgi:hypothetical protein